MSSTNPASTATINSARLNALLKRHASGPAAEIPDPVAGKDPVDSLLFSFLLWEATTADALAAWRRLREATVDDNDLRISLPFEIVEMIGPRYPRASERADRLRASLNDIYRREHAVSLARLSSMGKREQRAYVESLEGIAPFVAARTLLVCYGVHGVPVDERLCAALASGGVTGESADPIELSAALGRQVKADQAEAFHLALLSVADAEVRDGGRAGAAGSRSGGRTGERSPGRAARGETKRTAKKAPIRKGRSGGKSGTGA